MLWDVLGYCEDSLIYFAMFKFFFYENMTKCQTNLHIHSCLFPTVIITGLLQGYRGADSNNALKEKYNQK